MNDTTKWIMIILLLLLIGAAVFMLLRSPGKDNGAVEQPADLDRDGVTGAREGRLGDADARTADRGVYDQEADRPGATPVAEEPVTEETYADGTRTAAYGDEPVVEERVVDEPVVDEPARARGGWDADGPDVAQAATFGAAAAAGGATLAGAAAADDRELAAEPVADDTYAEPVADDTYAEPVADEPVSEPYDEPVAGASAADRAEVDQAAVEEVHPLTDDEIEAGTREEPLDAADQEAPEQGSFHQETLPDDERSGLEQAGERGAGYETVDTDTTGTSTWTDAPPADATDAPPADAPGAPQTADEIASGYPAGGSAAAGSAAAPADDVTLTDDATMTDDATTASQVAPEEPTYAPVFAEAAYGPGSAEPLEDGSGPAGWEVKGNSGSMLFHTPDSPSYDAVRAEVWFESEEAARAAGFAHWDRRRR